VSILIALLVGLVWWLAAWAFGAKALDAFLVTIAIVLGATAAHLTRPFVKQLLGRGEEAAPDQLGPPGAPGT
jgi:hypothetical protein